MELGLITLIGAEVLHEDNLSECVDKLYPPPSEDDNRWDITFLISYTYKKLLDFCHIITHAHKT